MNRTAAIRLWMFLTFVFCCAPVCSEELYVKAADDASVMDLLARLPEPLRDDNVIRADITALFQGYKDSCVGLEINEQGRLFVIMRDAARILYDDGKQKTFEEKLENPDLEDMLSQLYLSGKIAEDPPQEYDPGRFRVTAFLKSVYGATANEVKKNMVSVAFCGKSVQFNSRNRAAKALEMAAVELDQHLKTRPNVSDYIFPLGGTFSWRDIAGTNRLSPHSFATAIDLNPKHGAYWHWKKAGVDPAILRKNYPHVLVAAFEKHGFIWGGKWFHYDLMHFEYRPELFIKAKLLRKETPGRASPSQSGR